MSADPHAKLRDAVINGVLRGDGSSNPVVRSAAAANEDCPPDLEHLVDKIHKHAYEVTDDDVSRAQAKCGDDYMFEIIVSAALGASRKRLLAGLDALEKA